MRLSIAHPFFLHACLAAGGALAEEGPSFDCAKAESEATELVCRDAELAALDRRLAGVFSEALGVAEDLDAGAEEAVAELRAIERGWIGGRDDCRKVEDPRACVERAYLTREAELVAEWMLVEPFTEAAWACGEAPSQVVFVTYFDTELPGIRVEYEDEVAAMQLSPSGSGSRYDNSSGRYFWEKGAEALFVWEQTSADPEPQRCVLVAG